MRNTYGQSVSTTTAPSYLSSYLVVVTGNYDACKLMITMTSRNEMVMEEKTTK